MVKQTMVFKRRSNGELIMVAKRNGDEVESKGLTMASKIAENGGEAIVEVYDMSTDPVTFLHSCTFVKQIEKNLANRA